MPVSPTPLAGSPLKRLEIRNGSTCSIHDATQLESSLTATLEARRSTTGDKSDLLLQSHLGLKRVLSIQLTDLITSSCDVTETVTIDKPSQQMCIRIHQKEQTVLFTFKESRDFNVAIYTLKKFGFRVKDCIPLSSHTHTTSLSRSQSYSIPSTNGLGPRLSSITPLQSQGGSQAESPFSFTSMLNSEVPLTQIQSIGSQYQPEPPSPEQLFRQVIPVTTYGHHHNPYQLYLAQQSNMYQPRVSSPLRNAVEANRRDISPVSSVPNSQSSFVTNATTAGSLLSHRSISEPNPLSQSSQKPGCMGTNDYGSPYYQQSPLGSQDTNTSAGSDSQVTDETDVSFSSQPTQYFREFMPQTRNLPFVKDNKVKAARSKSGQKQTGIEHSQPRNKRRGNLRVRHENKDTSIDNSDLLIEENVTSTTVDMDSPSADSQITSRLTSSPPTISQNEATLTNYSSSEADELPTLLITDTMLERVNKVTSKLLDQYSADIVRGCDAVACAQFYLEQIHMARRDFWLCQLEHIHYG